MLHVFQYKDIKHTLSVAVFFLCSVKFSKLKCINFMISPMVKNGTKAESIIYSSLFGWSTSLVLKNRKVKGQGQ